MSNVTPIENHEIRGLTLRTMFITVGCCISMCVTVMGTYFGLKGDIKDVAAVQETTNRVNELRLKTLEARIDVLEAQMNGIRSK